MAVTMDRHACGGLWIPWGVEPHYQEVPADQALCSKCGAFRGSHGPEDFGHFCGEWFTSYDAFYAHLSVCLRGNGLPTIDLGKRLHNKQVRGGAPGESRALRAARQRRWRHRKGTS